MNKRKLLIQEPILNKTFNIEYSIHYCTKLMKNDIIKIFNNCSNMDLVKINNILIIPTFQHSRMNLLNNNIEIQEEKDKLLQNFLNWGCKLIEGLKNLNEWGDLIDPSSGYPFYCERGGFSCNDLEMIQSVLPYSIQQVGNCTVLEHPKWKTNVYPAIIFTTSSIKNLKEVLQSL